MKFAVFCCAVLAALPLSFAASAQDSRDTLFLTARDAFRAGDRNKFDRVAPQVAGHELAPYVESYRLRLQMDQGDTESLRAFLERNDRTYVAEKLRADWIRWAGRRSNWSLVEAEYPRLLAPEQDVSCYQQQARWARNDASVLEEAGKLWQTLMEVPDACRPVLDTLVVAQKVGVDDVWQRIHRQIEVNKLGPAKVTLTYLPEAQMPEGKSLEQALGGGAAYLAKKPANWAASRTGRELAVIAIQRLATTDPYNAAQELEKIQVSLKDTERQWAWGQVALQGARRHISATLDWYAKAGNAVLSEEALQWRVRAALREHDWRVVKQTIQAMPPVLAAQPEWIYWLGRAWKAGGQTTEAEALFGKIAGQASFYGNLADEELGKRIMPPAKAAAPTVEERRLVDRHPELQRALAFFRLDMRTEAVREWNWALRGMDDRQLLAAADLAKRYQIWDRAINTADRTKNEHDYSLRFLAPYSDQVRPVARNQALDDAWVYGLMRQESRFVTSARSNVGASGLMQLMPATAKWVAKKIGLKDFTQAQVTDTNVNVLLGTSYMRLVMENLDNHPVLASAAYNAGPGRARKWRAERPLEGAIYAETIPFSETRDYVKKVMSNAVYYSTLFNGQPDSLKNRLGVIGARSSDTPKDADLP